MSVQTVHSITSCSMCQSSAL